MGTWGYGLFSNDTASDVRDDYRELILERPDLKDRDATEQILERFGERFSEPPADPVVWLALAASESLLGRLDPALARRAVKLIDDEEDIREWREQGAKAVARRRAVLARLRARLMGPQRPRRNVPSPRRTNLAGGDVLAYRDPDARRYLLLRVARISRGQPVCILLDYAGFEIPPIDEIIHLRDYLWIDRFSPKGRTINFTMQVAKGIDYPDAGYTVIGNIGTRPGDQESDASRTTYWQTALDGSVVVSRLIDNWPQSGRRNQDTS